jgi:uncharacterized membrane protein
VHGVLCSVLINVHGVLCSVLISVHGVLCSVLINVHELVLKMNVKNMHGERIKIVIIIRVIRTGD